MGRDLARCAVVITGASSGIGRAAALAFACRGSRLVLAARAGSPLEQVAKECETVGAETLWLQTDVRDEGQAQSLRGAPWIASAGSTSGSTARG